MIKKKEEIVAKILGECALNGLDGAMKKKKIIFVHAKVHHLIEH